MSAPSVWFPTAATTTAPLRLFCLPYAGGNAAVFRDWQGALGADVQVVAVRPPGRLERIADRPYTDLESLVEALVTEMLPLTDRPFALFGVSMGALVAFETARRLSGLSRPPQRLYVASYPSPSLEIDRIREEDLTDDAFLGLLARLGALPDTLLDDPATMRLLLPAIRADFRVTGTHAPSTATIDVPVTAVHGVDDAAVSSEQMARWADVCTGGFELVELAGDHFLVHGPVPELSALLRTHLTDTSGPTEETTMDDDLGRRLAALSPEQRSRLRARLASRLPAAARTESRPGSGRRAPRWSLFFFGTGRGRDTPDQYELMLECARFADRNGFEALWVPERHFDTFGAPYPSPAVLAAALATATENLHIRAGSIVLPLHDPIRVAEDWAVVDNISRGRTGMALASGWHANDFVFQPTAYDKRKEILVEELGQIRELFAGREIVRVDGSGTEITLRSYPSLMSPELPMWITSSSSEQTWRTGAQLGLNVLTGLVEQSVDVVADRVRIYHEELLRHGRDPQSHTVTAMVHTFIGRPGDDVRGMVQKPLIDYLGAHIRLYEKLARSTDLSIDPDKVSAADKDALAMLAFERYFSSHGLFGTPDDAMGMVHRLVDAGVDEIACLIDFGLDGQTVLDHLAELAALRDVADEAYA